jgi:hypothetical protein
MTIDQTRRSQTGPSAPAWGGWGQAGARCRPEQASRPDLARHEWRWVSEGQRVRARGAPSPAARASVAAAPLLEWLDRNAERRRHDRDVETLGICLGIFAIVGIVLTMQA